MIVLRLSEREGKLSDLESKVNGFWKMQNYNFAQIQTHTSVKADKVAADAAQFQVSLSKTKTSFQQMKKGKTLFQSPFSE